MNDMNTMYGGYPYGYPPQTPYGQQYNFSQMMNMPYPQGYGDSQYSPFIQQDVNPYLNGMTQQQQVNPCLQQNNNAQYSAFNPYAANPQLAPNMQPTPPSYTGGNPYLSNIGGYGYSSGYGYGYNSAQSQYNTQFNNIIENESYGNAIPDFDPFECLRGAVLSDAEKEKAKLHTPVGYSYNGMPIYNDEQIRYQREQAAKQQEFAVNFMVRLSQAAHHDDEVSNEEIESYYNPKIEYNTVQPRYEAMSSEQLRFEQEKSRVDNTFVIYQKFQMADYVNDAMAQKVADGYAKIKESHDRILGIDPNNMNLKSYLANAGALYVDALAREQRKMAKDGTNKYERNHYKSMFENGANPALSSYTSAFEGEEYVPLENRIKEKYIRAKMNMKTLQDGSFTPSTPPPHVDPEIQMARESFLKEATKGMVV